MVDNKVAQAAQMKQFYLMWLGQLMSILASGITSFALGIWILNKTQSVTEYSAVFVITVLPGLLLAPFIGVLIDRHRRKHIIIAADSAIAVTTLILAWLYWTDSLQIWHIYLITGIGSVAQSFHITASMAAVSLMVPKNQLARAAGLNQLSGSLSNIAGPLLAGLLLSVTDLAGILMIDILSFIFAVTLMFFVKVPELDKTKDADKAVDKPSFFKEAQFGWHYIVARKGLLYLLGCFAVINLVCTMALVLVLPMAKYFAVESQLGMMMAFGGSGALLGAFLFAKTGGPKRKIHGVIGSCLTAGVAIMMMGLQPSVYLVAAALFLFNLAMPVVNGSSQVIWQTKVAPAVQGRVFTTRRMLAQITLPIGALSVGPLADWVFEPLMAQGGALAASVGQLIGTGPGRGLGLIMVVVSIVPVTVGLVAMLNKTIMNIETDLPDQLEDSPPPT